MYLPVNEDVCKSVESFDLFLSIGINRPEDGDWVRCFVALLVFFVRVLEKGKTKKDERKMK